MGDQVYGAGVWASLALMCASAVCGSITDLAFDLEGYLWQLMNCLFTASYSLYLRGVMDKVVELTVNKTRLDEFSMVRLHTSRRIIVLVLVRCCNIYRCLHFMGVNSALLPTNGA